ncbi:tubulin glycylase 3A-like isoform X1 [Euwallacea fornicatus]|uniref:tubulin glycylase 3A-like isoform X1 n=1 Tax=Euwallacea fornicatus TaxID=995702 RepID=UPI00338E9E37
MIKEPQANHNSRKSVSTTGSLKLKSNKLPITKALEAKVSRLLASAPSSPKLQAVTPEIQETIDKCARRSKSCLEGGKIRCTITSERLAQLKKNVENAVRDHRIFSIKGGWPVIRRELTKRNFIEKFEHGHKQRYNTEDVTSNLPVRQDWESPANYVEKCERTVMSRMLSAYDCDFYWSMRKEPSDLQHRGNGYKLINRFSRSVFASKEGLTLLLQQSYWYSEDNVANINFPRCYVLGFPDHYNLFLDDFHVTACMGVLKWFTERYEQKKEVHSMEGTIPHMAFNFAMERCAEYIARQRHQDIDKEFSRVWDHEWEQFLGFFYSVVHHNELFADFKDKLLSNYAEAKIRLKEMAKHWPQYDLDGMRNIWILKPGNKCRGRGIQLVKNIGEVERVLTQKIKYVIQKYIERPLIIYKTKFDIRQWFMVTNVQPLTIWMYRDSYLRFSGQMFSLENFHESLHLTNHAVQCRYANGHQRDKALPDDNMWDCHSFKAYLKQIGNFDKWSQVIFPGMRQSIVCAMLASQDTMDRRPNTYELYGADFMLTEDYTPWLLEINCSPDLSSSTSVTSRLCSQCMEDIIKVIVDRRKDPNVDTGLFDLIYKQNYPRTPPYLGMNLSVRGRKIFRQRPRKPDDKEMREKGHFPHRLKARKSGEFIRTEMLGDARAANALPDLYSGPVFEDLIEKLNKTIYEADSGIHFVLPEAQNPIQQEATKKKLPSSRGDRVPKFSFSRHKINPKPSLSRKPNGSENIKPTNHRRSTRSSVPIARRNYFGLFRKFISRNQDHYSQPLNSWEKETFSILKSESLLSKSQSSKSGNVADNKSFLKSVPCLNLPTFDLNKLLPEIKSNINNA